MMKRAFDIIFAALGLIILFPFFILIAFLIKLDSPGPVFYRGVRSGRHGEPFVIFKFRSMIPDTEKNGGDTTALHDSRITKIGAYLRKYKIDELPQLLNVLKGNMSIVGPRPELMFYIQQYNKEEMRILSLRPGITDLSSIEFISLDEQVGFENADKEYEENILSKKNSLRLQYIETQSFWLDIKIIYNTLWKIVGNIIDNLKRYH